MGLLEKLIPFVENQRKSFFFPKNIPLNGNIEGLFVFSPVMTVAGGAASVWAVVLIVEKGREDEKDGKENTAFIFPVLGTKMEARGFRSKAV